MHPTYPHGDISWTDSRLSFLIMYHWRTLSKVTGAKMYFSIIGCSCYSRVRADFCENWKGYWSSQNSNYHPQSAVWHKSDAFYKILATSSACKWCLLTCSRLCTDHQQNWVVCTPAWVHTCVYNNVRSRQSECQRVYRYKIWHVMSHACWSVVAKFWLNIFFKKISSHKVSTRNIT